MFGGIVTAGEGPHGGEAHDSQPVHRRFGATGQNEIGPPVIEQHLGQHHRLGSRCTGRDRGVCAPMQAQIDGHLSSGRVGDQHRHGERVDSRRSSGSQLIVLFMHRVESADASPQHHRDPGWINATDGCRGHGPGLTSCQ